MSSSPKAPSPPDYIGAARETAKGNLENIKYQTEANRVDQYTDFGSTQWAQDANGRWTQTQTLSPDVKAAMDAQMAQQRQQSELAQKFQTQFDQRSNTPFSGPSLDSYLSNVPSVNTNYSGFNGSSIPQIKANFGSFSSSTPQTSTSYGGPNQVDLNAPQFDQSMASDAAKAAYESQMGLMNEDFDKANTDLDSKLRLQGLTPGTEAYNNAMQNQLKTQGQIRSQAANSSVLSGNDIANKNYASALAGYGAKIGAQGQAFSQGMSQFAAENAAKEQAFGQELAKYGANQTSQQLSNDALGDMYSRAFAEYTSGQDAISKSNQAQNQAYAQASDRYTQDYARAHGEYMMPLNVLGSLNNGSPVNSPQMPSYMTAGTTGGADILGATTAQAQYNQGLYNSQSAAAAANNAAYANLFGTLLSSYFGG